MPITEREKQDLIRALREEIDKINRKHSGKRPEATPLPWIGELICCQRASKDIGIACVCSYVTQCPDHGEKHWGSHD